MAMQLFESEPGLSVGLHLVQVLFIRFDLVRVLSILSNLIWSDPGVVNSP